jgi:hypothetical protein
LLFRHQNTFTQLILFFLFFPSLLLSRRTRPIQETTRSFQSGPPGTETWLAHQYIHINVTVPPSWQPVPSLDSLSTYLNTLPQLSFTTGEHEKAHLDNESRLRLRVSHETKPFRHAGGVFRCQRTVANLCWQKELVEFFDSAGHLSLLSQDYFKSVLITFPTFPGISVMHQEVFCWTNSLVQSTIIQRSGEASPIQSHSRIRNALQDISPATCTKASESCILTL